MRLILTLLLPGCIAFAGCQNRQAKIAQLNAQYKTLHQQYFNDCIAPMQGGTDAYFKGENQKSSQPRRKQRITKSVRKSWDRLRHLHNR